MLKMMEYRRLGSTGLEVSGLAWLLTNPLVPVPIVDANTVEQLQASLAAVGFRLTPAEMQVLDDLSAWSGA